MSGRKIDINKAGIDELSSLVGVGRAKAEAIVDSRKAKCGFKTVSDLKDVPGIGPSILEQNHGTLSCSRPAPRARESFNQAGSSDTTYSLRDRGDSHHKTRNSNASKTEGHVAQSAFKEYRGQKNEDDEDTSDNEGDADNDYGEVVDNEIQFKRNHRPFELLSDSESNSSQDFEGENGDNNESGEMVLLDCEVKMSKEKLGDDGEDSTTLGVVASLRSRSSITSLEKSVMKRKSEGGGSKDGSPEKKPCRTSAEGSMCDKGTNPSNSSTPSVGTKCTEKCLSSHPLLRKSRIPSKANPPPELANWLKTFQEWSHPERLMALDELVELCEPTQVRHVMAVIEPQFQRDFISLLPKELALYVLSYLEPKDLCRAAQTCRYWRLLAEDNLLWREKCKEESIDEHLVYENRSRKRSGTNKSPWKTMYMRQKQIEFNWRQGEIRAPKVLKGHDDHVITCLEFSGTKIVSGSDDNTLKVWSAVTGKCLRTLVGHTGGVWSSQMRDSIIISGSTDRTLKVWNADTGQCVHTLYGHTSTVRCMCLYENKVVSGSRDATLRLWDVDSGQCLHVLMGHVAAVRCVQYDGRRVVSGAYDYMVKVWDPDTETCLHTLQGHTNRVYSLQFDGNHIVSGSLDTSIRVWDVETGQCLHTLIGHQSLTSGMELKDNILVSGNADSTVKVWDIKTGQCLQTLQGPNKHQSAVTCLQFSKKFVITSSDDGTVKVWSLKTGDFLRNLVALDSGGSGGVVWRIRCSNTKLVCAVGSRNGTEETKLLVLDFDVEESGGSNALSSPTTTVQ